MILNWRSSSIYFTNMNKLMMTIGRRILKTFRRITIIAVMNWKLLSLIFQMMSFSLLILPAPTRKDFCAKEGFMPHQKISTSAQAFLTEQFIFSFWNIISYPRVHFWIYHDQLQLKMPWSDILEIEPIFTAWFIANGIKITTGAAQYYLGTFHQRDLTLGIFRDIWNNHNSPICKVYWPSHQIKDQVRNHQQLLLFYSLCPAGL